MMGLRSSTPRIFAILSEMTRLVTAFAFIFVWAVNSLVLSLADRTLKGLTRVPDTARIALDVTMERNVILQRRLNNPGASGELLESRKTVR